MLEKFNLQFDALQEYVARKALSEPYKPKKRLEIPQMRDTIKTSLKKAIGGDFKDFSDNSPLAEMIFNELKNDKNHHQKSALELLAMVEGNY